MPPKMNLAGAAKENASAEEKRRSTSAKVKAKQAVVNEDDEDEDEDDEELVSAVTKQGKGNNNLLFGVIGVVLVVFAVLLFLLLSGGKKEEVPPAQTQQEQQPVVQEQQKEPVQQAGTPSGLGTQNFLGDTNMSNSDVMTNPDMYVEDIYGLTTRVDYTVHSISNVADFVSYEKHRGTWGGGLELYWLDATYKNQKYVIQIPFKYYKELDDVGIVPVKMEVLTIAGAEKDKFLSVISYMQLDEETLKSVLKTQSK